MTKIPKNTESFKSAAREEMPEITCPWCGCENVHIGGVSLLAPDDCYNGKLFRLSTNGDLVFSEKAEKIKTPYRGVHVGLELYCEGTGEDNAGAYSNHHWLRFFAFHKGHTFYWDQLDTTEHDKMP